MDFIGLILSIDIHQHYLATGKSAGGTLTYLRAFSINVFLGPLAVSASLALSFFSSVLKWSRSWCHLLPQILHFTFSLHVLAA